MSQGERFSAAARAHSFRDAFRGVAVLLATQHNARIHAVATLAVLAVGFWLGCTRVEWAVLVLAIGLVWLAEGVNTALEALGDAVSADPNPLVGRAKVVVDSRATVLAEAGDLVQAIEEGAFSLDRIHAELGEVVSGERPGRQGPDEVTLFKSVGSAAQDVAASGRILEVAEQMGLGATVEI